LKVLLTGATGFVGSHVLDSLCARDIPVVLLLRPSSDKRFIEPHLSKIETAAGSIEQPESLPPALNGVTHVIHCAGRTKAVRNQEYFDTNHIGTRNLVKAVRTHAPNLSRFVHISSLAASGPATSAKPADENDPAKPVSIYGESKLAGENEVKSGIPGDFVIIRPPAVYGPRDTGFLSMFKAVQSHILPSPSEHQALSLVYVKDLAEAIVTCLTNTAAARKTYFVASPEVTTGRKMAAEIAALMKRWTIPFPLPAALLWPVCFSQQLLSRLTRRPSLLNLQKFAELRAPGWVCSPARIQKDLGVTCRANLASGLPQTLEWYQTAGWLKL